MNIKYLFTTLFLIPLLLSGCINEYEFANQQFNKGNYENAIEHYTRFINYTPENSPLVAKAKLERAEALFKLGKIYFDGEDYQGAKTLFYFSNNDLADEYLAHSYYYIAQEKVAEQDYGSALSNLGIISKKFENTQIAEHAMCYAIEIHVNNQNDYDLAWLNYKKLVQVAPDAPCIDDARLAVEQFCGSFLIKGDQFALKNNIEGALTNYEELINTPTKYQQQAISKTQKLFINEGTRLFSLGQYEQALESFNNAESYGSSEAQFHKNQIANKYFESAQSYLNNWQLDNAAINADKAKAINPTLSTLNQFYATIEQKKINRTKADSLFHLAKYRVISKRYEEAKVLIQQAVQLYPLLEGTNSLLVEINQELNLKENAPQIAIDLIKNTPYVAEDINRLSLKTPLSWSSLSSPAVPGNYEVTASTEDKSHIFQWLVNLKTNTFFPMNVETKRLIKADE